MRGFLAVPIVPGVPNGVLTPRARTERDRERALRDALFLACLLGLLVSRMIGMWIEAKPSETPIIIHSFVPEKPVPPPPIPTPEEPQGGSKRPVDEGMPVVGEDADTTVVPEEPAITGLFDVPGEDPGKVNVNPTPGPIGGRDENAPPDEFTPYDEAPIEVRRVVPEYPEIARQAGLEGVVYVSVQVGVDGRVHAVRVLSKPSVFDDAAVSAVRQWHFRAAQANGHPIAVWIAISVRFRLH